MSQTTPVRQSNLEALRIVAMLLVLGIHANFTSLGNPLLHGLHADLAATCYKVFWEEVCMVCVNVFVLISGYFSIRLTLRGSINFAWILLYYFIVCGVGTVWLNPGLGFMELLPKFNIVGGMWFISAYILLMMASPWLNAYLDALSDKRLAQWAVGMWVFFIVADEPAMLVRQFNGSYSVWWLINLYIQGKAIRRLSLPQRLGMTRSWGWYAVATICSSLSLLLFTYSETWLGKACRIFRSFAVTYSAPFVVIASVGLFCAFANMKFSSKAVNRLAMSSFPVYIVHLNPGWAETYMSICREIYGTFNGLAVVGVDLLFFICLYLAVSIIDQPRIWLWNRCGQTITSSADRMFRALDPLPVLRRWIN